MTGSDRLAMAFWVRSKAAAARVSRLPGERCALLDSELVEGLPAWAWRGCGWWW